MNTENYYDKSFVTSGRSIHLIKMIDLPQDIRGKVILDIGAGASDVTALLKERGAHAVAIDFRYTNLEELAGSMPEKLRDFIRERKAVSEQPIEGWFPGVRRWWRLFDADSGVDNYTRESAKAYRIFIQDIATKANQSYVAAFAERLPFPDNSIDYCFSVEAITAFAITHENPKPLIDCVSEAMRVLRPGGELRLFPWIHDPAIPRSDLEVNNGLAAEKYLISNGFSYRRDPGALFRATK